MKNGRKKLLSCIPDEFKKFLVTGAAATSLDYILYSVLCVYFHVAVSKLAAMLAACSFSFTVNRKWTFLDETRLTVHKIFRYMLVQSLNIFVNVSINSIALWLTQKRFLSYIIATGSAMAVNFLCQKLFVFSKEKQ